MVIAAARRAAAALCAALTLAAVVALEVARARFDAILCRLFRAFNCAALNLRFVVFDGAFELFVALGRVLDMARAVRCALDADVALRVTFVVDCRVALWAALRTVWDVFERAVAWAWRRVVCFPQLTAMP